MQGVRHALDVLESPPAGKAPPVCVLFGGERFLKSLVRKQLIGTWTRGNEDAEASVSVFNGETVEYRDVADELSTVAMFGGGGPRLAFVEEADKFVERNRSALENYVSKPRATGVLILDVDSWPSNTRLYKAVDPLGWVIDCRTPEVAGSRAKVKPIDEPRIVRWLVAWARSRHRVQLPQDAAEAMLRLVGPEFGMLDQELAKLALFVPENGALGVALVNDVVGGWRTKTAWDLNDAIADGNAATALEQLDRLIQAGQEPAALFGTISWSLRRYAAAARLFQEEERRGKRPDMESVLRQAGFWGDAAKRAELQLKQIGRQRAFKLYRWLLEADLGLKGSHSDSQGARFLLEQLCLRLSRKLAPQPSGKATPPGG